MFGGVGEEVVDHAVEQGGELAGVASGLQSTAYQLGGTIGNAVLGAVLAAKISSLLPAAWHAAHLPPLTAAQLAGVKDAVSVGAAPACPPPMVPSSSPSKTTELGSIRAPKATGAEYKE